MNFTIAHTECSLGWGGQEIRILTEMRGMRNRGHRLLLYAPERSQIYQRCKQAGFSVCSISDRRIGFPATVWRLARLFRREGVQVVNPHSSRDGWMAGLAARWAGVPLIIRSRHIEVEYPNRLLSRFPFHYLPHLVITTGKNIRQRLIDDLSLAPDRVECIPTGIDLAQFNPSVTGTLHQELSLDPRTPLVGMVSVLRRRKGYTHFVQAAAKALQRQPNIHFLVAGDGPGKAALEEEIRIQGVSDSVRVLGHRDDVPNVLASLAIVVLPSTANEGVPQVILQAQAMEKAVLTTAVGGIQEVVEDGKTGVLVPPEDTDALADAMIHLLEAPEWRIRLGKAGREQVAKKHSAEVMCDRLERIYTAHLRGGQPIH